MRFYFNCDNPLPILRDMVIKRSKVTHGVSVSQQFNIGSHGPFKLEFKDPAFASSLKRCLYFTRLKGEKLGEVVGYKDQFGSVYSPAEYDAVLEAHGSRVIKGDTFADEEEWWSESDLTFSVDEVVGIYFLTNAPNLYPRRASKARKELATLFPTLYSELTVADPYLMRT